MAPRKPSKPAAKPSAKPRAATSSAGTAAATQIPLLEWIAAGIGLALTLFVLCVIGWETANADHRPPEISLQALKVTPAPAGYLVEVQANNRGRRPAAQVAIEGELRLPGQAPEFAEATFDYIPDHSMRQGGLVFSEDPRRGKLTLRAKSFVDP